MHPLRFSIVAATLVLLDGCAPPRPPVSAPEPPQPSPTAPDPGSFVHISSDDPSRPLALYRIDQEHRGTGYRRAIVRGERGVTSSEVTEIDDTLESVVCLAPCEQHVGSMPGQEFFLGGEGITNSRRFRLDLRPGAVNINARPGSAAQVTAGTVLVTIGSIGLVVGTVVFPIGVTSGQDGSTKAGGTLLGVGALALAGGIAFLVTGQTRLSFGAPQAAAHF